MKKERIVKDDGRYLIYYTFDDENDSFRTLSPERSIEEASRKSQKEENQRLPLPTSASPA